MCSAERPSILKSIESSEETGKHIVKWQKMQNTLKAKYQFIFLNVELFIPEFTIIA